MLAASYVASFIGREAGKALYVGLYSIRSSKPMTVEDYWAFPAHRELRDQFGMLGFNPEKEKRKSVLWFDLVPTEFYSEWKGKLIVRWPPPERSWWRRAHKNEMPVLAVLEESVLDKSMPAWDEISLQHGRNSPYCQRAGNRSFHNGGAFITSSILLMARATSGPLAVTVILARQVGELRRFRPWWKRSVAKAQSEKFPIYDPTTRVAGHGS